jgi:hypothetical protein
MLFKIMLREKVTLAAQQIFSGNRQAAKHRQ